MEKLISIYDLSLISESLKEISPAMCLFTVLMQICDNVNSLQTSKQELADALGRSRRTVADWIIRLCRAGVIKYKYSGALRLNPAIYYKGTEECYKKALIEWKEFKSDIKTPEGV